MGTPRMMLVLLGAAALVVGAVASLALENWWILVVVLGLHALASTVVVGYGLKRASQTHDKPDPVTEARLEEDQADEPPPGKRDREVCS